MRGLSLSGVVIVCGRDSFFFLIMWWVCLFFFKQKTAYEMRISDWSSDVCSSDLHVVRQACAQRFAQAVARWPFARLGGDVGHQQIGRASCRERVCQYV